MVYILITEMYVRVTGIYISLGCEYNRNVCIRDCMYYRGVHITGVAVLPG